jgi:probable phosphoglycerate mutase
VVGAETRRFIGHLDVPLSPLGVAQVEALARRLRGVALDAIYCSDLTRTRHSAEILAAPHGLAPIQDAALREFAMGQWDGLTAEEIRALDARAFRTWMGDVGRFQFPGGESLPDLAGATAPSSATRSGSAPSACSRSVRTTRRSRCCPFTPAAGRSIS